MAFWNRRRAEPAPPLKAIPDTEWVEDVVARLKATPPANPLCFVPLTKGFPATVTPFFSGVCKEEDLSIYLSSDEAASAIRASYDEIIMVGDAAALWAFLNNPRKNGRGAGLYEPPYGLSIDLSYDSESPGYVRYGKAEIQRIGFAGIAKGFDRNGELNEGCPERVQFPVCIVCGRPSRFRTGFHCTSCDFTAQVHDKCIPGRSPLGASVLTIGGSGLRCPKCGARG